MSNTLIQSQIIFRISLVIYYFIYFICERFALFLEKTMYVR